MHAQASAEGRARRRRLADIAVIIWHERRLGLVVFGLCAGVGLVVAMMQPSSYQAQARLLIRLGQEYVFQPQVGAAGAGAFPMLQQVVNAETSLLQSSEVARRAIESVGVGRLMPELSDTVRAAGRDDKREAGMRIAQRALAQNLDVTTTPETPIITLSYKSNDPDRAALTLNAILDAYSAYRREVLVGPDGDSGLMAQTAAFETRATQAGAKVQSFLLQNGIGDFDAELKALGELQSRLDSDLVEARARRQELEGQASALGARTRAQPADIELYADNDAARRLVDLKLERAQLLGRYQPEAPPIKEIDARIGELEGAVAAAGASATRRGPNPVRQEIESQFLQVEATARAQGSREGALETQRQRTMQRLRLLQELEPQYRQLLRERAILEDNARAFRARAEEAAAFGVLAGQGTDTVRTLERANPPSQGSSPRMLIALGAGLLGLILGAALALGRGLMRDRFATPIDAAHRLELPVLAVTGPLSRSAGFSKARA